LDTIGWLTQQVTTTGAVPTVDQLNQFFACLNEASDPADPPGVAPAPPISAAAAQAYVNAVYQGLLGRAPDAGGASYWAAALVAATSRATFTNALAHSDEFYRVKVIETAYSRYLHRAPDAAGLQYWTSQMQAGLTDAQLEAGFIASSEFASVAAALHPMLSANDAVITELYSDLLGRSPDTAGESFWVGKLNTGATLYNVALGFTASPEREGQTIQSADYQGLLGRTASPAEIAAWVGLYEQGQTNEDIQAMFAATDEFFNSHS
jgi:hypothetical protein